MEGQNNLQPNRRTEEKMSLKFIPIGGMGEVTRNMYVYETPNDMVLVDCGIGFPPEEEGRPENTLLIPDFSYVLAHQNKLRALVITHGHEDHIGAIPYLLRKICVPVYAARLPAGMIREKLKERGPKKAEIRDVTDGQRVPLGRDFSFEYIRVQQAIDVADALGRKVTLAGLSLEKNFEVARNLGYLAVSKGQVIDNAKLKKLPVSEQLILVSGSQGQSNSALSKMARGGHRSFKIGQGDLVLFSSDLIPGNEDR